MDEKDLEKLGLNKNEARVYFGLLKKGQAAASDLVKTVGVHRNIVYDNLDKLIGKGLVSYITEGTKKKFIAEDPKTILGFLEDKKKIIDKELVIAKNLLPGITKMLSGKKANQNASLFRGVGGIKKILLEVLSSKEFWVIGISNASVEALGETFWTNFNAKRRTKKIKEHLLFNHDFKNVVNIKPSKFSEYKILPRELTQVTEILIFKEKVAITVYSKEPVGVVIEDPNVFETFRQQFSFLWKIAKK